MIVTLTPNTGLDYTLKVSQFSWNTTLRATEQAWGMGGKATDVAWILGQLGEPVLALGFAGGFTGLQMEGMLKARGVTTDFVWVEGETRLNVVLIQEGNPGDRREQSTLTAPGMVVSVEQVQAILERYGAALEEADCIVLGGSLPLGVPGDFYPRIIALARLRGLPVIFDSSGPALRQGLLGRPTLIKPNQDELGELFTPAPQTTAEIYHAARLLQSEYGTDIIITLGFTGALAVLGPHAYRVPPLEVPVKSTAGAGDGVLAGMALAYARHEPPENGLRYGFALAGAILQTLATADYHLENYQELLERVEIIPFQPG